MVNLIFNEYDDNPLRVDLSKIDDDAEPDNMGKFQKYFEITGNEKDIVDQNNVYELCSKKIKSELTNQTFKRTIKNKDGTTAEIEMKVVHKRIKTRNSEFRDKTCFVGIRFKDDVDI
jgi:hypothetical protein